MIANLESFHSDNNIEVADLYVIFDCASTGIDDTQPDVNTLANVITKKQSIDWSL
jgi:hypothetical protein